MNVIYNFLYFLLCLSEQGMIERRFEKCLNENSMLQNILTDNCYILSQVNLPHMTC